MNKQQLQLIGKWEIIGAEEYDNATMDWQQSNNYVKEMFWEFTPKHFLENDITIGVIEETAPSSSSEQMSYSYSSGNQLLKVEIFTSTEEPDNYLNPQADQYQVIEISSTQIKLSILNEYGCPPPYFRYILQKRS